MKIIIILLVIAFNAQSEMYSAGTFVPYFLKAQTNVKGDTEKFDINPYFGISTQIHIDNKEYFVPELGYSYFTENPEGSRKEFIFLQYNFAHVTTDKLLLRYGFATTWYRIIGKGGTTRLNNGTGYTTFKNPDKTVTSYFTTFNLGGEYFISSKEYSVRFDLHTMGFTNFADREQNYLLTINFYR